MLKRLLRPAPPALTRTRPLPDAWWLWLSEMSSQPRSEPARLALVDLRSRP